jgi:hypothetical protein
LDVRYRRDSAAKAVIAGGPSRARNGSIQPHFITSSASPGIDVGNHEAKGFFGLEVKHQFEVVDPLNPEIT